MAEGGGDRISAQINKGTAGGSVTLLLDGLDAKDEILNSAGHVRVNWRTANPGEHEVTAILDTGEVLTASVECN